MTIYLDKEKRSHFNYGKKIAENDLKGIIIENKYNSFSKIVKGKHPEVKKVVYNPLLGR